jgi:hypothetical protein
MEAANYISFGYAVVLQTSRYAVNGEQFVARQFAVSRSVIRVSTSGSYRAIKMEGVDDKAQHHRH